MQLKLDVSRSCPDLHPTWIGNFSQHCNVIRSNISFLTSVWGQGMGLSNVKQQSNMQYSLNIGTKEHSDDWNGYLEALE